MIGQNDVGVALECFGSVLGVRNLVRNFWLELVNVVTP